MLEPSCGSCEFIRLLNQNYDGIVITGIECNKTIYDNIQVFASNNIHLYNDDFIQMTNENKYDLIIGNPPFYVLPKTKAKQQYHKYFDGRPNIFILFIIKSLNMLNNNGILSFILPKNFLNCLYYNKTREYIAKHFKILNITYCDDEYIETKQSTIILIVQNNKYKETAHQEVNDIYFLNIHEYVTFGDKCNISTLKELYKNSTTLSQLGLVTSIGTIVWNQHKNDLTDDTTKTRLIYNSDIKDNQLTIQKYQNIEKKNYINLTGNKKPLLVVNRGFGIGKYAFNYCLIDGEFEYMIENHLICVKDTRQLSNQQLLALYKKL